MILFRHIFLELVKVLLVTTSVLVTVIAFGAAIKPLSENLLGPVDLLRYIMLASVPMLQFALPFSAAFAGVVVYHRLTIDNEIVAMAASGIPYRRVLMPAVALGIVLTVFMVGLLDFAIPMFWRELKQLVAKDITRGFVAYVQRGEAINFESNEIYADEAYVERAPKDSGAEQRVRLVGVAAIEFDGPPGNEVPGREFTAQYATADIHSVGAKSYLKVVLQDATVFTRGDLSIAGATVVRPETIDLGRTLEEGTKGFRTSELWSFLRAPETFSEIALRRGTVVGSIAAIDAWDALAADVANDGVVRFRDVGLGGGSNVEYECSNADLAGTTLVPRKGEGRVEIRQKAIDANGGARVRRSYTAPSVAITMVAGPRYDLVADNAIETGTSGAAVRTLRVTDLTHDATVTPSTPNAYDLPNAELVRVASERAAAATFGPVEALRAQVAAANLELETRTDGFRRDIIARMTQRALQAITAFLMIVTASILAILFRNRTPLFVYSLAFIPAIIDILVISSGEQMLRANTSVGGFVVAVIGNVVLAGVGIFGAWRVGRH
ncbi:MAG: LptF/LptG family permease [Phycisphaerae bacterium]|nr:LptF/LptG family permease [Phycisphaerae bacterium]